MLLFVKPRVLKDELNARFREEHPSLPPSLTLSKIRSVKRQALLGCYRAVRTSEYSLPAAPHSPQLSGRLDVLSPYLHRQTRRPLRRFAVKLAHII